jgi:prepilin-type N-terminal cleavage/methylation domain-containing protein
MRRAQQGFTLIEIVIAFTILSLTTVLVVNLVAITARDPTATAG